jgi:hypothetical protein
MNYIYIINIFDLSKKSKQTRKQNQTQALFNFITLQKSDFYFIIELKSDDFCL